MIARTAYAGRDILAEDPRDASRLGLPTGGAIIAAWCEPLAFFGPRVAAAISTTRPTNTRTRGRAAWSSAS